jgi:alpha-L-fucosidase 2
MIHENFDKTLRAAKILGINHEDEPLLEEIEKVLPLLDPVVLGKDDQIKEYREETNYGSVGNKNNRQISHLVGLYPGEMISKKTPEWLKSARITLEKRGDKSTGWVSAHRLCMRARTGDGFKAYKAYSRFIQGSVNPNLWGTFPPFQIEANFGITAGVCEMLMQSHTGVIEILPAISEDWRSGSFQGLRARGNFTVGCVWENKIPKAITITAESGGVCRLKFDGAQRALLDNKEFSVDGDRMFFPMVKGETVHIIVK